MLVSKNLPINQRIFSQLMCSPQYQCRNWMPSCCSPVRLWCGAVVAAAWRFSPSAEYLEGGILTVTVRKLKLCRYFPKSVKYMFVGRKVLNAYNLKSTENAPERWRIWEDIIKAANDPSVFTEKAPTIRDGRVGYHRFLKLSIPYDCVGLPISLLPCLGACLA